MKARPKISLLIASRIEGNKNHNLELLLDDLRAKCSDLENFEVLIKFDDDDDLLCYIDEFDAFLNLSGIKCKVLVSPRGRGYADVHKGYSELMQLVSPSSFIIGAIADDFRVITQDWDKILIDTSGHRDLFIIHPHKTNENVNIDNLIDTIHDESSFWSKQLIYLCQCQWWIYATDAWTTALEYWLSYYRTNYTLLTHISMFQRKFNGAIDTHENTERWKVRDETFKFTRSPFFKEMVRLQAVNIV